MVRLNEHVAEAGDLVAKGVFKEEIIKRFEKGRYQFTMIYLLNEGYLEYLDDEKFVDVIEKNDDLLRNGQWADDIVPLRFWGLSHPPPHFGGDNVGGYVLSELIERKLINNSRIKAILTDLVKLCDPSQKSHGLKYDLGQQLSYGLYSGDIKKLDAEIIDLFYLIRNL